MVPNPERLGEVYSGGERFFPILFDLCNFVEVVWLSLEIAYFW